MNSMIGAQSDSIGRGAEGSEFGEESGTLESRSSQRTGMEFGSITVEIVAPVAVSNHPSLIGESGSGLRVGADTDAASGALFGCRARSCRSRQCGMLGCGLESVEDQVSADIGRIVQTSKSDLMARA